MVAVMEQNVLMQAFGDSQVRVSGVLVVLCVAGRAAGSWTLGHPCPARALTRRRRRRPPPSPSTPPALQMTVAEATDIADNALEHTVRCILQAVQVGTRRGRGAVPLRGVWATPSQARIPASPCPPTRPLLLAALTSRPPSLPALVPGPRGPEELSWCADVARPRHAPLQAHPGPAPAAAADAAGVGGAGARPRLHARRGGAPDGGAAGGRPRGRGGASCRGRKSSRAGRARCARCHSLTPPPWPHRRR